jgi:hypothetical protein
LHNIGFVLKDGEGVQIHFRGTKITVKVSKEDSDGKYTMLEMVHPPNVGPALHITQMLLKHTTYWKASIKSGVVKNSIMYIKAILCLFQKA